MDTEPVNRKADGGYGQGGEKSVDGGSVLEPKFKPDAACSHTKGADRSTTAPHLLCRTEGVVMMLTCTGSFCCVRQVAANALIKKGSLLIQKDLNKEAMECFARAEELDPRNSDIFHHRGQVRGRGARDAAAKSGACELFRLRLELLLPFFLLPSVFLSQRPGGLVEVL